MTKVFELELMGCAPEPLMAYLKALGVFRLVSEQKDPDARARWRNDAFLLRSTLDREAIERFFLDEYRPTPIVSPWNGRFKTGVTKGDKHGLDAILSSSQERFSDYRHVIKQSAEILKQEKDKNRILQKCRAFFPDIALDWIDAVYILTSEKPQYPPLTSNGGTLGTSSSGDVSMNFAKNLVSALGHNKRRNKKENRSRDLLSAAIFGDTNPQLDRSPSGQWGPGAWGPNSSVGFDSGPMVNPWDFLFAIEGALVFAGASVRRLSPESRGKAAFPFTVDPSAAGYGTAASSEHSSRRAEFWAPLWELPSTLAEVSHTAMEGRAQLGRRQASNGAEFSRAIVGLGVEKGISSFQRFGFLQRTGNDGVFATPIGRFAVKLQPKANVLFDLDAWLNRLRSEASRNNARAGLRGALRQLEGAIMEFCQQGREQDLQDVVIAVGRAQRWLSRSGLRKDVRPLGNLSWEWATHAADVSAEFRLARAMASILGEGKVGPVRENLEPVDAQQRPVKWSEESRSFVWRAGGTLANMLAVLERRSLDGRMRDLSHPPLKGAYSTRLNDVVDFLNGRVDVQRMADLALGLSFVRFSPRKDEENPRRFTAPRDLPMAYAVMKLTLLPGKFKCREFAADDVDIAMEPSMLALLRAGRVKDAYKVARRRLIASGFQPLSDDPGIPDGSEQGRRLAAALLFPVDEALHCALAQRALRKPERLEAQPQSAEAISDNP